MASETFDLDGFLVRVDCVHQCNAWVTKAYCRCGKTMERRGVGKFWTCPSCKARFIPRLESRGLRKKALAEKQAVVQ